MNYEDFELQDYQHLAKPITCPHCQKRNLAFVTEYHKVIGGRIGLVILLAFTILSYFVALKDEPGVFFVSAVLAIVSLIVYISILVEESHTHVQAICKDCGYIWLLD